MLLLYFVTLTLIPFSILIKSYKIYWFHQERHKASLQGYLAYNLPGKGKKHQWTIDSKNTLNMFLWYIFKGKNASMFQLNDDYYEDLTLEKVDRLLDGLP